jgi:hypothetical protein
MRALPAQIQGQRGRRALLIKRRNMRRVRSGQGQGLGHLSTNAVADAENCPGTAPRGQLQWQAPCSGGVPQIGHCLTSESLLALLLPSMARRTGPCQEVLRKSARPGPETVRGVSSFQHFLCHPQLEPRCSLPLQVRSNCLKATFLSKSDIYHPEGRLFILFERFCLFYPY